MWSLWCWFFFFFFFFDPHVTTNQSSMRTRLRKAIEGHPHTSLWALPTPKRILAIGSYWELCSHSINDCESQRSSFLVSQQEFHKMQKFNKRPCWRFSFIPSTRDLGNTHHAPMETIVLHEWEICEKNLPVLVDFAHHFTNACRVGQVSYVGTYIRVSL